MSEVFKELASVFRAECANCGGPLQASLQRMAEILDAKAAEEDVPMILGSDVMIEDAKPESDVIAPTDSDEPESNG